MANADNWLRQCNMKRCLLGRGQKLELWDNKAALMHCLRVLLRSLSEATDWRFKAKQWILFLCPAFKITGEDQEIKWWECKTAAQSPCVFLAPVCKQPELRWGAWFGMIPCLFLWRMDALWKGGIWQLNHVLPLCTKVTWSPFQEGRNSFPLLRKALCVSVFPPPTATLRNPNYIV